MHHRIGTLVSPFVFVPLALITLLPQGACSTESTRASMTFGAPRGQQPANGTAYNFNQQPITLSVSNVVRTGTDPVTYRFEVATNSTLANPVFTQDGVPEGASGVTSVQLPNLPGDATYYWLARAVVSAVSGEPSPVASFVVRPNVVIQPPQLVAPAGGSEVTAARPTFTVQNAARTGPAGTLLYEFQVSTSAAFGSLATSATVQEQPSQTSWTPTVDLPDGMFFWRVRASDSASSVASSFSNAASFTRRGFAAPGDQIDLRTTTIVLGLTTIYNWPATSTVTKAEAGPGVGLCIHHTKLGVWPRTQFFDDPNTLAEGNQWIFANIGGRWYGGAGHWYRPGQACKDVDASSIAAGTFYQDTSEPLRSWMPRIGETFAVMSATPARFYPDMRTSDERSNVVLVKWGG